MAGASYKSAGVDIPKAERTLRGIKSAVKSTYNKNVVSSIGLFGGVFDASALKKYKNPVLVSSIDGVGTKLMVAAQMKKWDTVGIDLVNHSANDIATLGAEPLFFLDYVAGANLKPKVISDIVRGMAKACRAHNMALIGGETAEMPGVYCKGEYDLAGCVVGVAEKGKLLDGRKIKSGDVLLALPSNGLHTNGYSLARDVLFKRARMKVHNRPNGLGESIGEALLKPHVSYSRAVVDLNNKGLLNGAAHITGGGIGGNVPRILPKGLGGVGERGTWPVPAIFKLIQERGKISESEMYRAFNMGVGMVLVVSPKNRERAVRELKKSHKIKAYEIGFVTGKKV
ncbi:MAG: phosphoribosylformylglycinamidine cyclo-ligase [Candidatus Diapherotrites archaeon]|nr:phosphoribosylformylglycinamidine cyclo-ligase [Candidatus Micrarchaeota archaeon]MBU1939186.1 phosphoribosylformylglycinamidine cyclo-ligase [Candidatus Micrarchaeota archaeon]